MLWWLTPPKAHWNQSARSQPPVHSPMNFAVYGTRTKVHHWYPDLSDKQTGDTQYLRLVFMIHNTYVWYPWYAIFLSGIHDTRYLCVVLMIPNVSVWTTSLILCMVCPVPSNFPLTSKAVETLVSLQLSHPEISDHDQPMSCLVTWLSSHPKFERDWSKTVTPMRWHTDMQTNKPNCVYI